MQPVTPTIGAGLHVALQLTEPADHALLGVIANRARVDEDDVGAVGLIHGVVAVRRELPEHQLGIAHVHLAAVGLDVDGGARARKSLIQDEITVDARRVTSALDRRTQPAAVELQRDRDGDRLVRIDSMGNAVR